MNAEAAELLVASLEEGDCDPSPFGSDRRAAQAVFEAELERLDLLIHREILRLRGRYELSLDEFRGLYVSDKQVESLLRKTEAVGLNIEAIDSKLCVLSGRLDECGEFDHTPWRSMARRLELSRLERDLVLLSMAPELDPKYENLIAYLNNDASRKLPTAELAIRLFAGNLADRTALRESIAPGSRLAGIGLIELVASARDLPRLQRGLRLAAPVIDWLTGLPYEDERCAAAVTWHIGGSGAATSPYELQLQQCAQGVRKGGVSNLVFKGPTEEESSAAARRMLSIVQKPELRLDLSSLRLAASPGELANAVALMARLFDAGVIATPLEALDTTEGRVVENCLGAARRLARQVPLICWCGTAQSHVSEFFGEHPDATPPIVTLHELSVHERLAAWRESLGSAAAHLDPEFFADRFVFGSARIRRVVRVAQGRAAFSGAKQISQAHLIDSVREVSMERCRGVTGLVSTPFDWDDLILPAPVKRQLRDFVRSIELRPRVLDEWGFAARLGSARNSTLLLKGISGGGKTLSAKLIAKTLGLDMHRIDLASVVSKYIGETEKNLDRAFDAARRANAVLFIDEADALFGKRSEVKDAHDRYANVETAYLLQKIEDHEGVVILATNLANNIDEAFLRRLHFVVEIPMPDIGCRERLWRRMISPGAPLDADVDIPFLARQFVLAGGDIRNIVLDAAYLAAQENGGLHMRHFLVAVARQFAKRGKVATAADFREYSGLLAQGHQ